MQPSAAKAPSPAIVAEFHCDAGSQSQLAGKARQAARAPLQLQSRKPGRVRRLRHRVRENTAETDQVGFQDSVNRPHDLDIRRRHQYSALPRELPGQAFQRATIEQILQGVRRSRAVQAYQIPIPGRARRRFGHAYQQRLPEKLPAQISAANAGAGNVYRPAQVADRRRKFVKAQVDVAEHGLGVDAPAAAVRDGQRKLEPGSGLTGSLGVEQHRVNPICHRSTGQTRQQTRQGIIARTADFDYGPGQIVDLNLHVPPPHAGQVARSFPQDHPGAVQHHATGQVLHVRP